MIEAGIRGGRAQLLLNVAVTVALAGVTDTLIRALGWNQPRGEAWPSFAPRGGTIGAIWVVLFAGMGAARRLVATSGFAGAQSRARFITGLIAVCLAYPFYTHFIHGHQIELIGNVGSFALAVTIVVQVRRDSVLAASFIGLTAAWIAAATVLVFALVRLNGWATA